MNYRATNITNVVYLTASAGSFDQVPGSAPLSGGYATLYDPICMYNPVMKSQLGVYVLLGVPVGQTVTFDIVRNDSGRTITAGDICEMTTLISTSIRTLDGTVYPRTRAGFAAAVAVGKGEVYIPPGTDITWETASPVDYAGSDLFINWHPSVQLLKTPGAVAFSPIRIIGPGGVGASTKALGANMTEGLPYIPVTGANITAMIAQGLVDGSIVYVQQNLTDATDPDSDVYATRVASIDVPGNAIYVCTPAPKTFTTAASATVTVLSTGKRNRVTGLNVNGNGNSAEGGGLQWLYQEDFSYDNCRGTDIVGNLLGCAGLSFGTTMGASRAVRCGGASGISAIGFAHEYSATHVGPTVTQDSVWGTEVRGSAWSNWQNIHALRPANRGDKFHHVRHCNIGGLQGHGSVQLAAITFSGDTQRNNVDGIQAYGNWEAGVLLTQVVGGTNAVKNNEFSHIKAAANNQQGAEINIQVVDTADTDNHFTRIDVGGTTKISDAATRNSYGHDHVFTRAFAAGDYTAPTGLWQDIVDAEEEARWSMEGKEMHVHGIVVDSSVTATPSSLRRALPNGVTAAKDAWGACSIRENATLYPGFARVSAGTTYVALFKIDLSNFATLVNQTSVTYDINLEVA